jgi:hypothetical protein
MFQIVDDENSRVIYHKKSIEKLKMVKYGDGKEDNRDSVLTSGGDKTYLKMKFYKGENYWKKTRNVPVNSYTKIWWSGERVWDQQDHR